MAFLENTLIAVKKRCADEMEARYAQAGRNVDASARIQEIWDSMTPVLDRALEKDRKNLEGVEEIIAVDTSSLLKWGALLLGLQGLLFAFTAIPGINKIPPLYHTIIVASLFTIFVFFHLYKVEKSEKEIGLQFSEINNFPTIDNEKCVEECCKSNQKGDDEIVIGTIKTKLGIYAHYVRQLLAAKVDYLSEKRAPLYVTMTSMQKEHHRPFYYVLVAYLIFVGLLVFRGQDYLSNKIFNIVYGSSLGIVSAYLFYRIFQHIKTRKNS